MKKGKEYFYEDIAADFAEVMNSYEVNKRLKLVFGRFLKGEKMAGKTFLDAGCGIGLFSAQAERRGAKVTALDVGKGLMAQVAKRCRAKRVVGLVTKLPFKDNIFDITLSTEVLEHTSSPTRGFSELVRVTKPGGKLIITVPNRIWHLSVPVASWLKIRPYQGLENWLWWSEVKKYARRHDLVIEKMLGFNAIPIFHPRLYGWLDFMDRFSGVIGPLMVNIALVARKKQHQDKT